MVRKDYEDTAGFLCVPFFGLEKRDHQGDPDGAVSSDAIHRQTNPSAPLISHIRHFSDIVAEKSRIVFFFCQLLELPILDGVQSKFALAYLDCLIQPIVVRAAGFLCALF